MIAPLRSPTRCASALVALLFALPALPAAARAQAPTATASSLDRHPLFQGIALTQAEEARVGTIRAHFSANARVVQDSMRTLMAATLAGARAGDPLALADAEERVRPYRERLKLMLSAERAEMRRVLTPPQQATYDRNLTALDAREQAAAAARP